MIPLDAYKDKTVGVFGLGRAGQATVDALLAGGAQVFAWDDTASSREILKEKRSAALHLMAPAKWDWHDIAILALSPGVPLTHPKPHEVVTLAKQHHVPVIGDIELLYQACPHATYIAITGTNGKSTTTALIGHILEQAGRQVQVGGNIGTAALSLEPLSQGGVYVLELSSYQLDLVASTRFDVSVLLNLTSDHLDRHGDMDGYMLAKAHIFDRQSKNDTAIVAVDDERTQMIAGMLKEEEAAVVTLSAYGNDAMVTAKDAVIHDTATGSRIDLQNIRSLKGQHNWQNALAAYAASRAVGVSAEVIQAAMRNFPGLAHRMEWVAERDGVTFINDSKATNADAASHALKACENIYWIAGGKPKAGGIAPLSPLFPRITKAYLIGEAEDQFAETLTGKLDFMRCSNMQNAVQRAYQDAKQTGKQAVVLLSPACASFDQYPNFEQRGQHFRSLVERLADAAGQNQ